MKTCENPACDQPLPTRAGRGRIARFCSTRCRVAAHRANKSSTPAVMRNQPRWVKAAGKRPVTPEGEPASSTNPDTWTAWEKVQQCAGDELGIMLGGGLGCYDLDHVTDQQATALIAAITEPIIFTEGSMSGNGVHIFVQAEELAGWKRTIDGINVERYTRERFIRMTGNQIQPTSGQPPLRYKDDDKTTAAIRGF